MNSSQSESIRKRIAYFSYFEQWSQETITQLCDISQLKHFPPDCVILGGPRDQKSYVFFITEGSCRVIEILNLPKKACFLNVCTLNRLSCFNIGEDLINRQIVSITQTECLLIPFYWLLERNEANIWNKIKQYLIFKIPKTEAIVENLRIEKKWQDHKYKLIRSKMKRKVETIQYSDVPYSLKVQN
ncbi:uncharacterized protein LOC123004931 [Tribolium madens]|uniref:uncharacterized protein LOC123004931 n=1 Tax=Tribolium madens TaxID=41895 RepID=UPI001CF73589|nr:uncharacterized protein LOC123004931 [Tribolium madens]